MLDSMVQAAGVWFFAAVAAQFAATLFEQAGAARSPEEDKPRRRVAALALFVASLATPALLLWHAYRVSAETDVATRLWLIAAPLAAMLGGGLVGAVAGVFARGAASALRAAAMWFALSALGLAVYAASPDLAALIAG
jgi:hypothetical protein